MACKRFPDAVSVAGCLGYDVLVQKLYYQNENEHVSVAGCLGYDVLVSTAVDNWKAKGFQLLVV